MKSYIKRFAFYEKGVTIFFILNLFFDLINKKLLDYRIPSDIVGYLFWLSLGLFLGFRLCKFEYSNILRRHSEKQG